MKNQWWINKEAICQPVYLICKGEHLPFFTLDILQGFHVCFSVR